MGDKVGFDWIRNRWYSRFFYGRNSRAGFGPFFGAVSFELIFGKDLKSAFKSGVGTLVGFLGGVIISWL